MSTRRATLIDVAKLAGVSRATAARALTASASAQPEDPRSRHRRDRLTRLCVRRRGARLASGAATWSARSFRRCTTPCSPRPSTICNSALPTAACNSSSPRTSTIRALEAQADPRAHLARHRRHRAGRRGAATRDMVAAARQPDPGDPDLHVSSGLRLDRLRQCPRPAHLAARHLIGSGTPGSASSAGHAAATTAWRCASRVPRTRSPQAGLELPPAMISEQEFSLSGGKLGAHRPDVACATADGDHRRQRPAGGRCHA